MQVGMQFMSIMELLRQRPIMLYFEHPWQETTDPHTGQLSFFNSFTGASQRHCPPELEPVIGAMEKRARAAQQTLGGTKQPVYKSVSAGSTSPRGQLSLKPVKLQGLDSTLEPGPPTLSPDCVDTAAAPEQGIALTKTLTRAETLAAEQAAKDKDQTLDLRQDAFDFSKVLAGKLVPVFDVARAHKVCPLWV